MSDDAFQRAKAAADAAMAKQPKAPAAPKPKEPAVDADTADEAEEEDADDSGGAGEVEPGEDQAAASAGSDDAATFAEVKELLAQGKVKAAAAKAGVKADNLDISPAKLRKLTRLQADISANQAALETSKREVATQQADLLKQRSELDARSRRLSSLETAVSKEDWMTVARSIQELLPAGMTYGKFTQLVAQGLSGGNVDPTTKRELEELKRDKQAREAKEAKETRERQATQQKEQNVQHVRTTLLKHPIADKEHGIEGFEDLVIAGVEATWNPRTQSFGKTIKEVADDILKAETAKATRLLKLKREKKRKEQEQSRAGDGRFTVPHVPAKPDADAAFKRAKAEADRQFRVSSGGRA